MRRTRSFTDDDGNQYLFHLLEGDTATLAIRKPGEHWRAPIWEDVLEERRPIEDAREIIDLVAHEFGEVP